jgi:DNA mismatch repair ATPase MutS
MMSGVSIAFSVAEQLLASSAYTLFVTHYPQLTSLSAMYSNVKNVHLRTSIDISPPLIVPFHGVESTSGGIPNAASANLRDQQPNQRMKFLYQVTGGPCDMKSG